LTVSDESDTLLHEGTDVEVVGETRVDLGVSLDVVSDLR
jgi:hypothetical protein